MDGTNPGHARLLSLAALRSPRNRLRYLREVQVVGADDKVAVTVGGRDTEDLAIFSAVVDRPLHRDSDMFAGLYVSRDSLLVVQRRIHKSQTYQLETVVLTIGQPTT